MIFHSGKKLTIHLTERGDADRSEIEKMYGKSERACVAQLNRMLKLLGDKGALQSPEQFRDEGDGVFAVKARCGLRAYGWFEPGGRFVVGRMVRKKRDKMNPGDRDAVIEERKQWQRGKT